MIKTIFIESKNQPAVEMIVQNEKQLNDLWSGKTEPSEVQEIYEKKVYEWSDCKIDGHRFWPQTYRKQFHSLKE